MNESKLLNAILLRRLAESEAPCIIIALPFHGESDFRVQIKQALKSADSGLADLSFTRQDLLAPIHKDIRDGAFANQQTGSMVILRSPSVYEHFYTLEALPGMVTVAEEFQIRRLLPMLGEQREFYILALSQKHTRLLRCDEHSCEEVSWPAGTPISLAEAVQTSQPDHMLENKSTGGPSTGAMRGVMFGTTTDREDKPEYMLSFFAQIDKAVRAVLRGSEAPLVPVAVERELVEYRQVHAYPHLIEPGVHGAPGGLRDGEMHRRALEVLRSQTTEAAAKALADFDKLVGTGHASTHVQDIIRAAFEGRVSHLCLQRTAEYTGSFDEIRQKVRRGTDSGKKACDLLNHAVIQTLRHGGAVSVLRADQMPKGVPVCAVYRYPAPEAQFAAGQQTVELNA